MQATGSMKYLFRGLLVASLATFLVLSGLLRVNDNAQAYTEPYLYYIADDATGGKCTLIGTWDASTKTCTMTSGFGFSSSDYDTGIEIVSDGITLDGNGQEIIAVDGHPHGVTIRGHSNVTVKNLKISRMGRGILSIGYVTGDGWEDQVIFPNEGNRFFGNDIKDSYVGVYSHLANHEYIGGNHIHRTPPGDWVPAGWPYSYVRPIGIYIWMAEASTVTGNTISHYRDPAVLSYEQLSSEGFYCDGPVPCAGGIRFESADSMLVFNNTVSESTTGLWDFDGDHSNFMRNSFENNILGLSLSPSYDFGDRVYLNSFKNNMRQAETRYQYAYFNSEDPTVGNHWSDFDEPAEGCYDADFNGVCDAPRLVFGGNVDWLPRTKPAGTSLGLAPKLNLSMKAVYWGSYADYLGRTLSADFHVESLLDVWYNLELTNVTNSDARIRLLSDLSHPPDPGHAAAPCEESPTGGPPCMRGDVTWDFTLQYYVPAETSWFKTSISGLVQDFDGNTYYFPERVSPTAPRS
ncbi:MAG: right-handed parallel beta-helix repeat-containing protein [Thermoleophilia bacterium]